MVKWNSICIVSKSDDSIKEIWITKALFGSLEGGEGMTLGDEKYRAKWKNLLQFFKRLFFLKNDKLILTIHINFEILTRNITK